MKLYFGQGYPLVVCGFEVAKLTRFYYMCGYEVKGGNEIAIGMKENSFDKTKS